MNQSMEANRLLEKYAGEAVRPEPSNELWKVAFASQPRTSIQNTNQVYENLLRICENIEVAGAEIQPMVNDGDLGVDERACLAESKTLQDMYLRGTEFDDIGPCLDDIQIYDDFWNSSAYALCNGYEIMKSNQIALNCSCNSFSSGPHNNSLSLNPCEDIRHSNAQIQETSMPLPNNENPIFADSEIEQYIRKQRYSCPATTFRQDEVEDPLRLWRKLNHDTGRHSSIPAGHQPPVQEHQVYADTEKPAKSVLAIFDFTMPSLSSSSASSSPAENDLELEAMSAKITGSLLAPVKNGQDVGLPELVSSQPVDSDISDCVTKTAQHNRREKRQQKFQDLTPPSIGSSLSPSSTSKKRKKNEPVETRRDSSYDRRVNLLSTRKPVARKTDAKKHSVLLSPNSSFEPHIDSSSCCLNTSPTLRAGAAYIEEQLTAHGIQEQALDLSKNSISMPDLDEPLHISGKEKLRVREPHKNNPDHYEYNTRSTSKPKHRQQLVIQPKPIERTRSRSPTTSSSSRHCPGAPLRRRVRLESRTTEPVPSSVQPNTQKRRECPSAPRKPSNCISSKPHKNLVTPDNRVLHRPNDDPRTATKNLPTKGRPKRNNTSRR